MIINIIAWVVFGLIAGALARLLVPGRQNIGWFMTILLGIVGAFVGGFLFSLIGLGEAGDNSFNIMNMIGAVIGAVIVLVGYLYITKGRTTT